MATTAEKILATDEASSIAQLWLEDYAKDPVRFCSEVLGVKLWSRQCEVAKAVVNNKRVAVKSGNSVGKTFLGACLTLWWLYTHCPSQVITTAPTNNQVEHQLWGTINNLWLGAPMLHWQGARCLNKELKLGPLWEAIGFSTDEEQNFQGFHSQNMMVIVDEANGVHEQTFAGISRILTGGNRRLLLMGNPIAPVGRFYDGLMNKKLGFHPITISALDTPFFTGEESSAVGELFDQEALDTIITDYGKDSPFYLFSVLAQFPTGQAEAVLAPTAWVEAAKCDVVDKMRKEFGLFIQMGVDVGRGGARSGWAWRTGRMLGDIVEIPTANTGQLRLRAQAQALLLHKKYRLPVIVAVDEIGVGAGVVDNWEKQEGVTCVGVDVGSASSREDCVKLRDELHWRVRELLDPDNEQPSMLWAVPEKHRAESERAESQLGSIRWRLDANGRIKVESKADMLKRNMPSPDEADMVTLAFADVKMPQPMQIASAMREKVFR